METHELVVPRSIPETGPGMRASWVSLVEMCFGCISDFGVHDPRNQASQNALCAIIRQS